jgi:hypothetical protein
LGISLLDLLSVCLLPFHLTLPPPFNHFNSSPPSTGGIQFCNGIGDGWRNNFGT